MKGRGGEGGGGGRAGGGVEGGRTGGRVKDGERVEEWEVDLEGWKGSRMQGCMSGMRRFAREGWRGGVEGRGGRGGCKVEEWKGRWNMTAERNPGSQDSVSHEKSSLL